MRVLGLLCAAAAAFALVEACAKGSSESTCMNTMCGAQCVDTATDSNHCGSCTFACASGQSCVQGKCTTGGPSDSGPGGDGGKCPTGEALCGSTCVNEQTDSNHCGNCTTMCLSGLEACSMGSCSSTCMSGMTLCIPDAGVSDGGPTAHCANLQADMTDCGACFNACSGGATCTMGKCVSTLLGSGTAADPWHTMTALANCAAYLKQFPMAMDGVYTTHPSTADVGVYCDMTHGGTTFEDFGFGQHTATYTGYTFVGVADFTGSTQFDAAFAYLFTRNTGLTNLAPGGWTDGNCCIENTGGASYLGLAGATYMEPAVSGVLSCSTTYSATPIALVLETSGTVMTSMTAAQAGMATSSTTCSTSGNPGIFVKKY